MTPDEQRWMDLAMEAGRVFTPTSPIDEPSLFAGRIDQVRLIVDVINQKGQHAILFGERGVGKTSLANVLSSFLPRSGGNSVLAPRVNCDSQDTFESVWRKVFEKMSDSASLSTSVPGIGFGKGRTTRPLKIAQLLGTKEVAPDTVRRALNTLAKHALPILIVDEFDRLGEEPRRAFADTVKMLSDHAVGATVVLVGVADSVDQLIDEHHSVERALVQVQMPRMSGDEIAKIIHTGLKELGMTIDHAAIGRISKLCQGLPHYAHLLGLHASRAAFDTQSMCVTTESVSVAIDQAIGGSQQSIRSDYEYAVRSPKKDNLFSDVLLACALAETTELGHFAAQDVREPLSTITGRRYEIPSFAQHLKEFCEAKRGRILEKSGIPRLYRYRFLNPLMQPFVIMRGLKSGRIDSSMLDQPETSPRRP
jgi:Cdc6-like AAA superfamily ATPase